MNRDKMAWNLYKDNIGEFTHQEALDSVDNFLELCGSKDKETSGDESITFDGGNFWEVKSFIGDNCKNEICITTSDGSIKAVPIEHYIVKESNGNYRTAYLGMSIPSGVWRIQVLENNYKECIEFIGDNCSNHIAVQTESSKELVGIGDVVMKRDGNFYIFKAKGEVNGN